MISLRGSLSLTHRRGCGLARRTGRHRAESDLAEVTSPVKQQSSSIERAALHLREEDYGDESAPNFEPVFWLARRFDLSDRRQRPRD